MVKTILFLVFVSFQATASMYGQTVSLNVKNESLHKVLLRIQKQSGYNVLFNDQMLKNTVPVNVSLSGVPIEYALKECFKGQPVTYVIEARTVVVQTKPASVIASERNDITITGIVTDEKGVTLPGVSVKLKGTTSGVVTDGAGKFSIRGPGNGTLVFSFIGFISQEIAINNRIAFTIKLVEENKALNEVVVIGYGTAKRKDLTGAVSSIDNKTIKDLAVTRVDQALSGKIAGVQVKTTSGEPGAAPQVRIRGISSISAGSGPLYVVDGFPIDNIQTLNPNDIESLDILKDASATAIYGSRGSNGVIIINTKRGKSGKATIALDSYYGYQSVLRVPQLKNSIEEANYYYDGIKNQNIDAGNDISGPPNAWKVVVPQDILDVLSGKNKIDENALDAILRTAPQKQYQLAASGGTEGVRYYLSGEFLDQDGLVKNSWFKRYNVRANIDANLSKKLTVKVNLNPSYAEKSSLPVTGTGPNATDVSGSIVSAVAVNPFYPLLDANGNYTIFRGLAANGDFQNPLAVVNETIANTKTFGFVGNVNASYKIIDGLNLNILLGGNISTIKDMTFKPQLPVFFNNPAYGTDAQNLDVNWLSEYTLNYTKTMGKHNISAVGGFTAQKDVFSTNSMNSNKFPNNLVPTLSATSGQITYGTSTKSEWSLLSYLARINYNYAGKYYLTASIRTDGSSRFGSEKKYGLFPSAALAWRISQEDFLKDVSFLSDLKIRTSYGKTGNNNIGNYQQYALINYQSYPFANAAVGGYSPGQLANPALTWETQQSFNTGVDISLFDRRINLSADYFHSVNSNLLLNVNVPAVTGFSTALQNIGEVKNKGWEFVLSTDNFRGKFTWSTDFNISTYKNKVTKLGPQGDPIYSGTNVTMIGQPIGMFYGYVTDGIFKNQADIDKGPIYNPGAADHSRPGDIRFKDISGPNGTPDGVINSFDKTIMGSPYPNFYYGMTNRFSYARISLSVNVQGVHGNQIYDLSRGSGNSTRGRYRGYTFTNNYWKSADDPGDGKTPRPNNSPTGGVRENSQAFLDAGSYLRVNNITVGYQLPDQFVQKIGISALRFYFTATNPFIVTKNTAFNPDVSTSADALTPGLEANDYPIAKSFVLGLNLSF
ncbi:TonB-dependent receptor [Mucilaginibacter sabulilitoris]|uniref:TonB-dependent receptor n=1 Tax=Mucilaginibacter sabulilitoris TaxID=1173583 RepID=A0ABZ0TXM5_9SPHI|nr:TonB-dependent receptor [Mucilaginibacter sabulilitoris]WPU96908.1 TonB-dependent receptor [Mucilaginibacter sabulilitoris]